MKLPQTCVKLSMYPKNRYIDGLVQDYDNCSVWATVITLLCLAIDIDLCRLADAYQRTCNHKTNPISWHSMARHQDGLNGKCFLDLLNESLEIINPDLGYRFCVCFPYSNKQQSSSYFNADDVIILMVIFVPGKRSFMSKVVLGGVSLSLGKLVPVAVSPRPPAS